MTTAPAIPKITCYACGPKDAIYFPPGSMRKALSNPDFKDYCSSCRREVNRKSRESWGMVKMAFPKTLDEMTAAGYRHEGTATCKACKADIEWWSTPKGKKIPMDHGTATPHWGTCPNAEDFRKPQAGRSTYEGVHE